MYNPSIRSSSSWIMNHFNWLHHSAMIITKNTDIETNMNQQRSNSSNRYRYHQITTIPTILLLSLLIISPVILPVVTGSKVLEMNDRFVELYQKDSRQFLIKFYAPWCHHCQELEPTWNQVAQQLYVLDTKIVVGRIDCTKYSTTAQHFGIRGFPTLMFITAHRNIEYRGERSREEIVDFALRVSGPPIRYISNCSELQTIVTKPGNQLHGIDSGELPVLGAQQQRVVMINVGPEADQQFTTLAQKMHATDWFFRSMMLCEGRFDEPGVYALKPKDVIAKYDPDVDGDLREWIHRERFARFAKLSTANMHLALKAHKYIVLTIVEVYRDTHRLLDNENRKFFRHMESIAHSYHNRHKLYQFGWITDLNYVNSLVMHTVSPLPNVLVLDCATLEYYLLPLDSGDVDQRKYEHKTIVQWLDDIIYTPGKVEKNGGDTYRHRIYRTVYETLSSLLTMYRGNPALTLVVFGLPISFLAMIIYLSCFSEMLNSPATDDDDEDGDGDGEEDDDDDVDEEDLNYDDDYDGNDGNIAGDSGGDGGEGGTSSTTTAVHPRRRHQHYRHRHHHHHHHTQRNQHEKGE